MSDRTKRHCMVVHAHYPLGEVRVQREAETLVNHGYTVDVICLRSPGEPAVDRYNNVNIIRLPVQRHKGCGIWLQLLEYWAFFFLSFFKLSTLHWKQRYNSIQVHNLPDFLVFAALFPKFTKTPIILDLHDLMPEFFASRIDTDRNSLLVKPLYLQERLVCQFADHVITVTEHWRQSLIKRGVSAHKCSVLMNLADHRIFKTPTNRQKGEKKGGNSEQFRLIYHGALPQRYGLDLVLQAIARLRSEISEIHFTVIGRGEYRDTLIGLTNELDLKKHVQFKNFIAVEELPAHIVAADLAVVPYRSDVFTNELLPTKLLEYAALGMPTVAARTMAISAYFDETMVQFFAPNDVEDLVRAIRELYYDRSRLATLAENIEQFNRQYNWTDQSTNYVHLIKQLTSETKSVARQIE